MIRKKEAIPVPDIIYDADWIFPTIICIIFLAIGFFRLALLVS